MESELEIQYTQRKIKGVLSRMERLNKIKEAEVQIEIRELKETFVIEQQVSAKIIEFINKKRVVIQGFADNRDKMRDVAVTKLIDQR